MHNIGRPQHEVSSLPVSALSLEEFNCESIGWEPTTPLRFQNAVITAILFSLLLNEIVSFFIRLPLVNTSRAIKDRAQRGASFFVVFSSQRHAKAQKKRSLGFSYTMGNRKTLYYPWLYISRKVDEKNCTRHYQYTVSDIVVGELTFVAFF